MMPNGDYEWLQDITIDKRLGYHEAWKIPHSHVHDMSRPNPPCVVELRTVAWAADVLAGTCPRTGKSVYAKFRLAITES